MAELISEIEIEISNSDGLHMRPAMMFVDLANEFESDIKVSNADTTVNAKSIMELTMLAATCGTKLMVRAEGPDAAAEATEALGKLVERSFARKTSEDAAGN